MDKQTFEYKQYDNLYERLAAYGKTDYYPFHMPGHKRAQLNFANPYQIDVTEIEGFDHLYHAEDILLESQKRLQNMYQSKKSYYLVNGSTGGILSAVGASIKSGDEVIIARNCHKSVYNAIKLFQLKAHYIYPQFMECGILGKIVPEQLEEMMKKNPNVKLVVITSPTYDGVVSDIQRIADITHKYDAILIVDEAHGAHFSLSSYFPESSIHQGADLVIHSLHKTLPSFTQTAALHVASDRTDCRKLEEMLEIFQSSSPSYVLMAGIDRCVRIMERSGKQLFDSYQEKLLQFYKSCANLRHLRVMTENDYKAYDVPAVDHGKILIQTRHKNINGVKLYHLLLEKYHLQMEMNSAQYVLAMTSIMDTQEGFDRLFWALLEIDRDLELMTDKTKESKEENETNELSEFLKEIYAIREKVMEISDVEHYNIEETVLSSSTGKICAEYVYLYPPGIPMIVPGEKISDPFIHVIEECRELGLHIKGMKDRCCRKILTVEKD